MALGVDINRALRTQSELVTLIGAVAGASPAEPETDWLEWKSSLDLSARESHAIVAKAILGFANRSPTTAQRSAEGCAYLLVGVEPGHVHGVEFIDVAKLDDRVCVYTGRGPRWSADFVRVDEREVLCITVEAPAHGDPLHPVRKEYNANSKLKLPRGALFVRRQGKSERADDSDIDMLSERAAAAATGQDKDFVVALNWASEGEIFPLGDLGPAITSRLDAEKTTLLAPLRREARSASPALSAFAPLGVRGSIAETRTEAQYRSQVAAYLQELEEALLEDFHRRALSNAARVRLRLHNETRRTFERVEFRLTIKTPAVASGAAHARHPNLPQRPGIWGTGGMNFAGLLSADHAHLILPSASPTAQVSRLDPSTLAVRFPIVSIRPEGYATLAPLYVVPLSEEPLDVEWDATAMNADGRVRGSLQVAVTGPVWTADDLIEDE